MILRKNTAGQIVPIYAWDGDNDVYKTGDAANIIAYLSIDGGTPAPTNDVHPTELDSSNMPGVYYFNLTKAETNGELIILSAKSSTSGVVIEPILCNTLLSKFAWVRTA